MSNDVVISKELQGELIDNMILLADLERQTVARHAYQSEVDELRAAPETVSLEGLEAGIEYVMAMNDEKTRDQNVVAIGAYLRRIIAPVQGGAVDITIKEIAKAYLGNEKSESNVYLLEGATRIIDLLRIKGVLK